MDSKKVIVTKQQQSFRLDLAMVALIPEFSRKQVKRLIDEGSVYLNKKRMMMANRTVAPGDVIEVFWQQKTRVMPVADSHQVVLFESTDYLVISKPAGIASQSTLDSSKQHLIPWLEKMGIKGNLFLVHRLDKDTSGLMIVAKTTQARNFFEHAFRQKTIEKSYWAIACGTSATKSGTVRFPILKDTSRQNAYLAVTSKSKPAMAKAAETVYRVVAENRSSNTSLFECKPLTGRTHQIRVHLAALGHPIVGDKTYSQNIIGHPIAHKAMRQLLHARELRFKDLKGVAQHFTAPLPDDFSAFLTEAGLTF